MKKIYVSLPISGYALEERKKYADSVKQALKNGTPDCEVITPFDVCPDSTLPYNELMGRDIAALLDCDAALFCKGWNLSKGCMAEHEVSRIYGKERFFETQLRSHFATWDGSVDCETISIQFGNNCIVATAVPEQRAN